MLKNFYKPELIEAGCDEVGRGCLAGPVFAAAVILPHDFKHDLINDSKQLKVSQRDMLYDIILDKALAYAIQSVSVEEIDIINILKAAHKAMHLAIAELKDPVPEHLLIDGNSFPPYMGIPHTCIIKGDGQYLSIAAASIIAKVERDRYMEALHHQYPQYNWKKNKGYGTLEHRRAIEQFGLTEHHRKTFKLKSKIDCE